MDDINKKFDVRCRDVEELKQSIDILCHWVTKQKDLDKQYSDYVHIIWLSIKWTWLDDTKYEIYEPDEYFDTFRFRIIWSNWSQDIDNIKSYDDIIELIDAIYSVNLPF